MLNYGPMFRALPAIVLAFLPELRTASAAIFPTDSLFTSQRQHYVEGYPSGRPGQIGLLHTPDAWEITTGSPNVRVAIISTGVEHRLLELSNRVVEGYNFVNRNTNTMDSESSGTGMATVLGANANNPDPRKPLSNRALGIAGIDWKCKIMPIKVQEHGYVPMNERLLADGINFAASNGTKIIVVGVSNGVEPSQRAPNQVSSAISNAVSRGSIVIVGAGGMSKAIEDSAAKDPFAITIGAAGSTGIPPDLGFLKSDSSNFGAELDLVAFGGYVLCIEPQVGNEEFGYSDYRSGTAFAAAMVGGVCSLMAAVRPDITAREAYQLLAAGAWDRSMTNNPKWNPEVGWGLVNAYNSVLLAALNIDTMKKLDPERIELSWRSPPDAQRRAYFEVDFRPDLNSRWNKATGGSFVYTTNRTTWTGDYNDGFYRVAIIGPNISFGTN
jgi:hypothetical protein